MIFIRKPPPAEPAENSTTLLSEFSSKFSIAGEVPDRAVRAEFDVGAMGENSHRRLHKLADGEFGAPPPLAEEAWEWRKT